MVISLTLIHADILVCLLHNQVAQFDNISDFHITFTVAGTSFRSESVKRNSNNKYCLLSLLK